MLVFTITPQIPDDYEYTTCDVCQEKFTNQSDYFKHISFAHDTSSEGGVNKCTNCTGELP